MLIQENNQPRFTHKNNPRVTSNVVTFRSVNSVETFGDRLRLELAKRNLKAAEVARRAGVTKQNLGRILNNTPHSQTGAVPKPSLETVERIAKAIEWDQNEARLAAGYAPTRTHNINGFKIELPDDVEMVIPYSPLIDSQERADEFREAFYIAYETVKQRLAKIKGANLREKIADANSLQTLVEMRRVELLASALRTETPPTKIH